MFIARMNYRNATLSDCLFIVERHHDRDRHRDRDRDRNRDRDKSRHHHDRYRDRSRDRTRDEEVSRNGSEPSGMNPTPNQPSSGGVDMSAAVKAAMEAAMKISKAGLVYFEFINSSSSSTKATQYPFQ